MYRVMTTNPLPDGSYRGVSALGRDANVEQESYEVVFKVPRLEAHVEDGHAHYTIVLPKYAAEEMRTQAAVEDVDGEQSRVNSKRPPAGKKPCVYVSYLPDDSISSKIATYIKRMLLDEYDVPGVVLEPEDGRLNYIDFDIKMKDCTHFVACLVPRYFDLLETQQGRPFLELKAATSTLASQKIVCVYPDSIVPPTQQRIQSLMPMELRKAFVTKPHVFYYNLGHMDVLETCLARFVGIEHLADLMQLPMSACLESASLGMYICSLYRDLGCTSVGDLAVLQEAHLKSLGMDKQQVARFFAVVEQEVLCLLLEVSGVGHDVWRRLVARHAKELQALPASKAPSEADSFISFAYTCSLPQPAIRELCKGDAARAHEVSLLLAKLQAIKPEGRADAARTCHFPEQDQSVKTLVARLWTPDVSRTMRAEAAELIRRKSLNPAGLEEIRHIAGLESLIKLVEEGLPAEKIAALWTLRNFGLVELYRSRMATMGVMPLCVGILEDTHQPVSVHHAAAAVLQVATTADEENVKKLSETNALPRLIACLYVKHRALKVAALGTLANMVTLDANKAACSRLRAVPRLVALLSNSTSPAVSTNAIGALAFLVRNDENRLKSWRCGAVEKLKSHVSLAVPHVSEVAAEAIQVLMAGPRIHPSEHFLTTSGRRLHAKQMRSVIHRLNTQHTYLQGVNVGAVTFQSAHPQSVAALSKRPASAGACLLSSAQTGSALNLTRVTRQDFDRARPSTAVPASGTMAEGCPRSQSRVSMALREVEDYPFGNSKPQSGKSPRKPPVSKIDPQNCSSEFMRKLTPRQQLTSVDRLMKGTDPFATQKKPAQANRMMTRALSTARPCDEIVKPKNSEQESRRQSGRHFSAMASVKYKTVTGKLIGADRIEKTSRRLSTPGGWEEKA